MNASQPLIPDDVVALLASGGAARAAGRWEEALAAFREAADRLPAASTFRELAVTLMTCGEMHEAEIHFRKALAFEPSSAETLNNLGTCLCHRSRFAAASEQFLKAARLRPDVPEIFTNLAHCYRALGDFHRAAEADARAAILRRGEPNLAASASQAESSAEAKSRFEQALSRDPLDREALTWLGLWNYERGDLAQAESCYRRLAAIAPADGPINYHLGRVLRLRGQFNEAIAAYERSLATHFDSHEVCYDLALALLSMGDLERGWPLFESRLQLPNLARVTLPHPRWHGERLNGQSIIVHVEGGYGDTLQFVRLASRVEAAGGRAILAVQPQLIPLLSTSGFKNLVPLEHAGGLNASWQVPLLSLPLVFGITLDSIPANVPYLSADPQLCESWQARLAQLKGLRVGLQWRGLIRSVHDARSVPFDKLAPIFELPGVDFVSLQHDSQGELAASGLSSRVIDFGSEVDAAHGPFMDTAAIMRSLDLVITCDTSTAHLAGALGVPVWVAQPHVAEWRWLADRVDSPWYPSMRLFRQPRAGGWSSVFSSMASEIRTRLSGLR